MFLTAQILGVIGAIFNIMSIQFKKKNNILIYMILASIMFIISYILLNAYTGAVMFGFGIIQILITYAYERNYKKTPVVLIPTYILIYVILGVLFYKSNIDILPIISGILFTLIIIQEQEKNIRSIMVLNIFIWTIYSYNVGAYTKMVFSILYIISIIIAIIRYDIFKKDTVYNNSNNNNGETNEIQN